MHFILLVGPDTNETTSNPESWNNTDASWNSTSSSWNTTDDTWNATVPANNTEDTNLGTYLALTHIFSVLICVRETLILKKSIESLWKPQKSSYLVALPLRGEGGG